MEQLSINSQLSMSIFIPSLQQLEKLVPELLQAKSAKHCLILLKTATLRWTIIRSLYDSDCDFKVEFEQEWFKVAQWQKQFCHQLPIAPGKRCKKDVAILSIPLILNPKSFDGSTERSPKSKI